jgi:aspartyl-tRNA(Asn)/glutamyl-tRNA(Gln) amidotransferase subunit B
MAYKPTIGLEIHVELNTNSKMFCSCKNNPDESRPNINICPVCTGQPGTLPVANQEAITKVIKTGLALHCSISEHSKFDRKNYFYPDLPKGYQISQYDEPLCQNGYVKIEGQKIGITRIHLEEDTGSLLHPDGANYSLVDLNRAGVPLMELVTEPDITSGIQAKTFAEELQLMFRYLGVSAADMEKGLMRVEVNISVSNTKKLGTKVEIKNLNSFKVVQKAIDFEIKRQTELLEAREKVVQETRGWNDKKEITFSQREKESAHDYRYFPEPDLLAMHFTKDVIAKIQGSIPELPEGKRNRFATEYGLNESQVEVFVVNKELSEYYEKVVSEFQEWSGAESKKLNTLVANYLISDMQGLLAGKPFIETEVKITPEDFAEFITMIYNNEINSKTAKMVLFQMYNTGVDPSQIVEDNNWGQMKDDRGLEVIIANIIHANPKTVADYHSGNKNALQFFAGQVMKETRGTANPQKVQELLKKLLSKS